MIIDGKKVAQGVLEDIKNQIEKLETKPTIAVIIVGEDPSSKIYVNMNYQKRLHYSIRAYSSFFFITDDIAMPVSQLIERDLDSENYIVIDELRIKTGPDLEEIISVYSMIPTSLLYI